MISFSYLIMLTTIGGLMLFESVRAIVRIQQKKPSLLRRPGAHTWVHGLPFRCVQTFEDLCLVIPVWGIGYIIGVIGAVMGIGSSFVLVPMLIYFLRMPTVTVIGSAAVLTTSTMAFATLMHALTNHLVDAVLALLLMVGGVIGAQFGARSAHDMPAEKLRLLLGLLIFSVGFRFAYDLVTRPENLYSIRALGSDT